MNYFVPKRTTAFIRGLAISVSVLGLLLTASPALGFDLKPSEIRGKSSKAPVSVLQNRYFLKSWRPEVGLMAGTVLDEAYLDTNVVGARAGIFFSEWLGAEFQMVQTNVSDSDDRRALKELKYLPYDPNNSADATTQEGEVTIVSPDPEVNAIYGFQDFAAVVAPFYGKLNLMDRWIVYTDLYLTAGIARMETDQGDKNALTFGAGERFYVGKNWSFRIDFKNRTYTETRAEKTTRKHAKTVDLGASYFFN